jgi:hypothetical protein
MATIIDKASSSSTAGSTDIQTAFTTYKALDRLKSLASAAANTATTDSVRTALQKAFGKGLDDLQTYLAQAPADKVALSYGLPKRRAETVSVTPSNTVNYVGKGILEARDAPIVGLTGNEVLRIGLDKPGASDAVTVDLSQTVQPPTLDSVSNAINAAIQAIPLRNPDGSVVLDDNGNPTPRWLVHFLPDKTSGKWGMSVEAPNAAERISVDQVGGANALIVASGQTALDAPTVTQMLRFDDAEGAMDRVPLSTIAGTDRVATARAALTPPKVVKGVTPTPVTVSAPTVTRAVATDASGFSYMVGSTSGDLKSNLSGGSPDLTLTKMDSEGAVVWQRSLGASGTSQGAAVSVSANGEVTVAGTVSGNFNGSSTDGDMLVARYTALGDEKFSTVIHAFGADSANALAVGADGSIFVGGKVATGGGDAFVARLDATGKLTDSRTISSGGSESVTALAVGQDGNLLALTNESGVATLRSFSATSLATDIGSVSLGTADARGLAVAPDGSIAIAGATGSAIAGGQANALSGGRDGFVTRINSGLSSATTTYVGSAGDDQIDSVAFMGGALYVGGRTTGDLDGTRRGTTDGFVSRIDAGTGAVEHITQFGQTALQTEPVRVAAASGGDTVLGALGLHRGTLNSENSTKLVAQTNLRAGDEFSISVLGGRPQKVTIQADDTLATLGDRVRRLTGSKATVVTATVEGATVLRIDAKPGSSVSLTAGAAGKDALAKLGLDPMRVTTPVTPPKNAPIVRPGGSFGLALTDSLAISTAAEAAASLVVIKNAISTTQTAYRSLYWDDTKAARVDGSKGPTALTAAQKAQLDGYKTALARLTPVAESGFGTSLAGFL